MRSLVLLISALALTSAAEKVIFCYLGSWATYRPGNGKFEAENIQPDLCTHLVYAFVGISTSGQVVLLDEYNDIADNYGKNAMGRCQNLKTSNPNLKVLVAIGGWNEGSVKYSIVVNNDTLRATFVDSIVNFTVSYGFDGFDLDWEYPGLRGGASTDKAAFAQLLKELRPRFDEKGLVLTAAVGAGKSTVDTAYDVPSLSLYLDYINVMTYDFHGSWDGVTGQNAPLYASEADTDLYLNVDAAVSYWLSLGADPAKLVLGMATYGRTFTLTSSSNHDLGATASAGGTAGKYTATAGTLGYNEFCETNMTSPWTVVWDDVQKVPYAHSGDQWIGYDDVRSLTIKSEYIMNRSLAGGMIWSLETDDFLGLCHGYRFPLLSAINKVLNGGGNSPGSAGIVHGDAPPPDSPPSSQASSLCSSEDFVRDPDDCHVFYRCQLVNGAFVAHKFVCPAELVFDTTLNICNYAWAVRC
ncbi:hypothetical protein PR048_028133 [Dryococelus australis]|uniref:Chitinase n=1 Tax=Dryococelus australis TaxID=614101 RepID=A0ABQ9GIF2_9NEOP|nr:hypothetical protein PR048_028133 [Dryococelus australis]